MSKKSEQMDFLETENTPKKRGRPAKTASSINYKTKRKYTKRVVETSAIEVVTLPWSGKRYLVEGTNVYPLASA